MTSTSLKEHRRWKSSNNKEKDKILNGRYADELLWDIGEELLSQGGLMTFRAPGGSMAPFIRHQDAVLIRPCKAEEVTLGDIILYERLDDRHWNVSGGNKVKGHRVIHRFLGRKKIGSQKLLITKGDANLDCDLPVLPEQVRGKVIVVQKKGWKIRLDTKIGRILNILFATISPFSFLISPWLKFMKPVGFLLTPALHRLSKFWQDPLYFQSKCP